MVRPVGQLGILDELKLQLGHYGRLMRIDRPIGIWLLLWPTLWALWISSAMLMGRASGVSIDRDLPRPPALS